ncbi:telomere length regulation protein-domain-containing protein [Mrakia frigida]|uniref:telomere length regulation TEL2 family protein n=1 Tax=Mrakia frigida TaxID=29902 RepID=UPI003FCBF0A3
MSSSSSSEETTHHLRLLRDTLKQPIPTSQTLHSLLVQPLDLLSFLPSSSSSEGWPGPRGSEPKEILLSRFMGSLQTALLENVVGTWWDVLGDEDEEEEEEGGETSRRRLMESWFCPLEPLEGWTERKKEDAGRVALSSYGTLVAALSSSSSGGSKPSREGGASSSTSSSVSPAVLSFILPLLARLATHYPLSKLYSILFHSDASSNKAKSTVLWESFARTMVSIPGKVMNAKIQPLLTLLQHLLRQGYLSPTLPSSSSLPPNTFFSSLLPRLLPNLPSCSSLSTPYSRQWQTLFNLLDFANLARVAESLLSHLLVGIDAKERGEREGELRRAGEVMELLLGRKEESLWEKVLLGGEMGGAAGGEEEERAKIGVWWVGGSGKGSGKGRDSEALEKLMQKTLALWSDLQFIKFSLVSKHVYILSLLLLLLKSFPPSSDALLRISTSPLFLNALTHYLSHPDRTIRYLGMMGAEVVSSRTVMDKVQPLDFGVWEGEEGGKALVRRLRGLEMDWEVRRRGDGLLGWGGKRGEEEEPKEEAKIQKPATSSSSSSSSKPNAKPSSKKSKPSSKKNKPTSSAKITVLSDSDDSLTGYVSNDGDDSSSSSSRSASPTPSDLDEYIEDPTLFAPKKKKVARPVYLGQLGELLGCKEEPEKLEVALKWGEGLIRRKRGFGLELEENTVYITLLIASLNDNFELEDFDNRKQGILNALVACSPEKAAPTLIEQYFHNQYSLQQRSAILTALAMGAREAASLPTITSPSLPSVDWPSKKLPPALHRKFLTSADVTNRREGRRRGQLEDVAGTLSSLAIEKGRESAEGKVEEFQREKRLRVAPTVSKSTLFDPSRDRDVGGEERRKTLDSTGAKPFQDLAAEFFILPLINRFWLHFQDESSKTSRLSHTTSYSSIGTGMILSPLSLSKLVSTLSILLHASRHSPLFLAVLAPEALELAVTIGSRPPAPEEDQEVSVLGASLELALVVLDASRELDGGRTLMVEKGGLMMGVSEWAELVFMRTEKGERVLGEGGEAEGRVRRASAGLCVLIGEIRDKWGRLVGF